MRKKLCPQCKIHRFYLKNIEGERLVVIVNREKEIIPIHDYESLDGFDTSTLYCLGCSWRGSVDRLIM
ncbi:MAG: hypothetical protein PHI32_01310 [Dysgonamonadaceae bacterium]|nr:hypothetical protein [Dysgonamonadaceae bacterium]MDD4728397.1 hypothetical protein [Dysgonamonadaceae bacterium]